MQYQEMEDVEKFQTQQKFLGFLKFLKMKTIKNIPVYILFCVLIREDMNQGEGICFNK